MKADGQLEEVGVLVIDPTRFGQNTEKEMEHLVGTACMRELQEMFHRG